MAEQFSQAHIAWVLGAHETYVANHPCTRTLERGMQPRLCVPFVKLSFENLLQQAVLVTGILVFHTVVLSLGQAAPTAVLAFVKVICIESTQSATFHDLYSCA